MPVIVFYVQYQVNSASATSHFVDGSSIVIAEQDVSDMRVQDILDSVLYAQIMSTHYYGKFERLSDWYRMYMQYLQKLGWMIDASKFELTYGNSSATLPSLILKGLDGKLDKDQLETLASSIADLYSTNSSGALKMYKNESIKGTLHNFQVLMASSNADGSSSLTYFGFIVDYFDVNHILTFISSGFGFLSDKDYSPHRNTTSQFVLDYYSSYVLKYSIS